ncbi:MAG TPA: class I tRNA ligase family protein, partial [Spirochaetales bacterium]|nr:class I tRNA ligase family protein [Spirochaetales bacterium]
MNAIELAKAYDPKDFEDRVYAAWKSEGHFKPAAPNGKKPFVVVIPPPNVTGVLHVGHGLNNSLQDILVRYHRMSGRPTLWVPGTDHAGIATQHVVEKKLREKGLRRRDMGREAFIAETWKVKDEHHAIITRQLEKIGASCDWSRERFTLDEGLSKAVREVFVRLFDKGLIYRGKYLVNWCCSCGTALADDEVEHEDKQGAMYRIRYPYADGSGFIEIATTRPETLLGDAAVAFNPSDDRYKHLAGKLLSLPLCDRQIPLIADSYVDSQFGTGLVKITPAHDPNDFEVGKRHELPQINILNPDGTLNDEVPQRYRGMKV